MAKITKIEPQIPALPTRKKVAAYSRVSMETERLHHSLSSQISYYSELIQKNPEWEYVGGYADEAITGTIAKKHAGGTVGPVERARHLLGSNNKHALGTAAGDIALGDIERKYEAGTSRRDIEGRARRA